MKEHSAQNEKIFESTSEQRLSLNRPALYDCSKLGSDAGSVIQANGRLSFGGLDACFTVFHSESASALILLTVWSLWGNPGMARCRRKSNWSCWIRPAA